MDNQNHQYLNRQFFDIPPTPNPDYNDLNQSIGEEMRAKYPYSSSSQIPTAAGNFSTTQTSIQTPSYQVQPNNMPPPSITRPLAGMMSAPPTVMMSAPPTGMMSAPPTGMMSAPPTGMNMPPTGMTAPPAGMMSAPPTGMMSAPPIGMINSTPTGMMTAPPISMINSPPTGMMSVPPIGMINSPPAGMINAPPLETINAPPLGMMSVPTNVQYNAYNSTHYQQTQNINDNFQSIHLNNTYTQNPITTVPSNDNNRMYSTSIDTFDDGFIHQSTSNDAQHIQNTSFSNQVQTTASYDSVDKNVTQSFFNPPQRDAQTFFGSSDKDDAFPAKVVKPRSLVKPKIESKAQAELEIVASPSVFPPIREVDIPENAQQQQHSQHYPVDPYQQQYQQQAYQQDQFQHYGTAEPSVPYQATTQYQVPVSNTASPMQYKFLEESFSSPQKQNISDVSFSNPQTPVNASAMSPMTPGSNTRFIENRFGDLATLIESRRSELDALRKKNFASYSAITGSAQKPTPFSPPPVSKVTSDVKSEDYNKLESEVKIWSTKYDEEKKKSVELEVQVKEMGNQIEDYKYRLDYMESRQSTEMSENQFLGEEIKMWSDKYEDEKKRSATLELQLKEMSNQLDDYDKKFQALRTDSTHAELIELQAQIEELNIERDDLHDETDSLRTQLLAQTAKIHELSVQTAKFPPDDSANIEYINNLKAEIEQLKLSIAAGTDTSSNSGIDAENVIKENSELRLQLEESHRKLEMVGTSSASNVDQTWPQDREEFIKQWTIQANEWNSMREQLETDKSGYYEIGREWEAESIRFKELADEREKEINGLKEQKETPRVPSTTGISQEEFQKKVKQLEMDMAKKWMSLLIRRKKSFVLRRSFDIMRQQAVKKLKVNTFNTDMQPPTGIQPPPIGIQPPPTGMISPPMTQSYTTNLPSPSQELRHRKTHVTEEEEKQLHSDFSMIKQLQRSSDKTVVIDRRDKIYQLMSSIFYKSIIWLLLIIVAFLYIKSCSIGTSSRAVRLTS